MLDEHAAPIAHATACASSPASAIAREPSCATTDAQGAYKIDHLYGDSYEVTAAAERFRPGIHHPGGDRHRARFFLGVGEQRAGVDVVLRGGAVALTGSVSDISGGPVAHARVRVSREDDDINGTRRWYSPGETDADGTFSIWVAPGELRVEAAADGYAAVEEDAVAPGHVELLLTPAGSIAGTVIDTEGTPVADALVTAQWIDVNVSTRSDNSGHFVVERLVPARYELEADTPSGYGRSEGSVFVGLAANVEGIVVRVHGAAHVSGRVVVEPQRAPCPEAEVILHGLQRGVRLVLTAGP